jgi:hypothetical protein
MEKQWKDINENNIRVSVSEGDFTIILRVPGNEPVVITADEAASLAESLLAHAAAARDMQQGVRQPRFPGKVER